MKVAGNHPLLKPYLGRPAILDSNLLLLQWCASYDRELIGSFKRLSYFQIEDIQLLSETLKVFKTVRTTPHVLTEVSNLANSLPAWRKDLWSQFFAEQITLTPEIYTASAEVASDVAAIRFGITDAALTQLASDHVILTIDWPLANILESRGLSVINFTHLREAFLYS
jgi:hypothetical protein